MSNSHIIVVKDACVLFDLIDLKILTDYFHLRLPTFTTPFVINEVQELYQVAKIRSAVEKGQLIVDSDGVDSKIFEMKIQNAGLTLTDCSVIELAIRKEALLLSSDKGLRNEALRQGVQIGGILWVIERLISESIITPESAIIKLSNYKLINSRSPVKEIDKLIHKLSVNQ